MDKRAHFLSQSSRLFLYLPVLLIDVVAFYLLSAGNSARFTPFSIFVAGVMVLIGSTPLVIKPGKQSLLSAFFALFLGATLLIVPDRLAVWSAPVYQQNNAFGLEQWRWCNFVFLVPVSFHLLTDICDISINRFLIACNYLLSLTFFIFFVLNPSGSLYQAVLPPVLLIACLEILANILILFFYSQKQSPKRAFARVLLYIILCSQIPVITRWIGIIFHTELVFYNFILFGELLLPVGIVYLIIAYDFFEIDNLIKRALISGIVSILFILVYFGATALISVLVGIQYQQEDLILNAIIIVIAGLLFQPVQARIQALINKWLYPEMLLFKSSFFEILNKTTEALDSNSVQQIIQEELPQKIRLNPCKIIFGENEKAAGKNEYLLKSGEAVIGKLIIGDRISGLPFNEEEQRLLANLADIVGLALAYGEINRKLETTNSNLETLVFQRTNEVVNQQKELAVLNERQSIARELHDSVSQSLFSIQLTTRAIRNLAHKDTPKAMQELQALELSVQDAYKEMRLLMQNLRSGGEVQNAPSNEKMDLIPVLKQLCLGLKKGTQPFNVNLHAPEQLLIDEQIGKEIYGVVREALYNSIKHAAVPEAGVSIIPADDKLTITIADNGCGFDYENIKHSSKIMGMGLKNIHDRVKQCRGKLTIQSGIGNGTRLTIEVPVEETS